MEVHAVSLLVLLALATVLDTCSCDGSTNMLCIKSEKQALLRFKQGLKDPSDRLSSWSASKLECCNWTGIICDKLTGHVQELHLKNPNDYPDWETGDWKKPDWEKQKERDAFERSKLQGNINASLLDLKYLSYLDLSFNDFGAIPIPSFIGSMVSLTYLNISTAGFEGLIPPQLGNLFNLRQLGIQGPNLHVENLNWLSNLSSLVHLDISWVDLSSASDWLVMINKLPSLLELRLSECSLFLMPSLSIVNFTSLQILEISNNYFFRSSIAEWIFSLSNLIFLNLRSNHFEGSIPNSFLNLTSLRILDLSNNKLIAPLPDSLYNLEGLVSLNLASNDFVSSAIASGLKNLTALRNLDLGKINFARDTIPEWLYSLQDIENLDLKYTNLSGKISNAIQNMTSLVILDLSYNELEGTLPRTIGNLCSLQVISLGGNKLGGEVTEAIENLYGCLSDNLRSIFLERNNFFGHLNDGLMQFKNLRYLDLSENQISGSIPESLGRLSNLQSFDISNNMLEGIVTEVHFANLKNLKYLIASHNRIDLKVSPAWVPLFHLDLVKLSHWNLGPQFPMWLRSQDLIRHMDLSCTGISDSVPAWFWNSTSHTSYLNLSHNQIHGQLPSYLGFEYQHGMDLMIYLGSNQFEGSVPQISRNVTELDLSNNLLSGDIFDMLCHPKAVPNGLKILHLGENRLTSEIPDCWMNWQSLRVIMLGNNNLTGKLLSSMGYLHSLQSLNLHNNSLFGEIPETLANCKQLLTLNLGLNSFVGKIPAWLGDSLSNLMVLGLRSNKFNGEIPREFCHLTSLQIVDLADNNLSGSIPRCLNNLRAMIVVPYSYSEHFYSLNYGNFMEEAIVVMKGREYQYGTLLKLITNIDFSSNKLSGEIPVEIMDLLVLRGLNLSGNYLKGEIPKNIGNMQTLESIDLSRNLISGNIPPSLSDLKFLSYLNLSYNNLTGQIPQGTQLQSFDASNFIGNRLCGPPLRENWSSKITCPDDESGSENAESGSEEEGYYVSMAFGFGMGFWWILGPLLFSRRWRYSYYAFLNRMWTGVYVKFLVFVTCRGNI